MFEKIKAAVLKWVKNIGLTILSLLLILVVTEIFLRFAYGIKPGKQFQSPGLKTTDTLLLQHGFYGDSVGIQRVAPIAALTINKRIEQYYLTSQLTAVADTEAREVYELVNMEVEFETGDFKCPLKSVISRKGFPETGLDSAIRYYLRHPVNHEGFRSIPFKFCRGGKKKVLLLGDSFTWGHSAENIYSSFSDNLLAAGYTVYNTGITCTDPVQYLQVAQQYIPLLKPDVVVMNVYLGNDVQYYVRRPTPFYPQVLSTNAGMLQTNFLGITITQPDSVYQLVMQGQDIPVEDSKFNKVCSYTAIGTMLWRALAKYQLVVPYNNSYAALLHEANKISIPKPDVNNRIKQLQHLCNQHNARLIVSAIPQINSLLQLSSVKEYNGLFDSIPYHLSPVKTNGYDHYADGHFNTTGHIEYAEFLKQLIEQGSD